MVCFARGMEGKHWFRGRHVWEGAFNILQSAKHAKARFGLGFVTLVNKPGWKLWLVCFTLKHKEALKFRKKKKRGGDSFVPWSCPMHCIYRTICFSCKWVLLISILLLIPRQRDRIETIPLQSWQYALA